PEERAHPVAPQDVQGQGDVPGLNLGGHRAVWARLLRRVNVPAELRDPEPAGLPRADGAGPGRREQYSLEVTSAQAHVVAKVGSAPGIDHRIRVVGEDVEADPRAAPPAQVRRDAEQAAGEVE